MNVSEAVRAELERLYRARADAETALTLYLAGVLDALDVPREQYQGFDDESGELLLVDGGDLAVHVEESDHNQRQQHDPEDDVAGAG